jgi:hypothetical protein
MRRGMGGVNTDDKNLLEFAFARTVGTHRSVDADFRQLATRLALDKAALTEPVEWERVREERWFYQDFMAVNVAVGLRPSPLASVLEAFNRRRYNAALEGWKRLGREPGSFSEAAMVAELAARAGEGEDERLIEGAANAEEKSICRAIWRARHEDGAGATEALVTAFVGARTHPWIRQSLLEAAIDLATEIGMKDPRATRPLYEALRPPFAVEARRDERLLASARLADLLGDAPMCLAVASELEPPIWDKEALAVRARCYKRAHDPRIEQAEADIAEYIEQAMPYAFQLGAEPAPARPGPLRPALPLLDGGADAP